MFLQNKILEFRLLLCSKVKPWPTQQAWSGLSPYRTPVGLDSGVPNFPQLRAN